MDGSLDDIYLMFLVMHKLSKQYSCSYLVLINNFILFPFIIIYVVRYFNET